MNYQVIARKWRPQRFDDVTGQSHVTTPLRNAIRSGRIPHALLLTGPRGVGKTTLARILARCLNCEKGPTDEPCGTCSFCEEITAGRSRDVQEIDAASRTGVDDIREVIDSIRYAPSPGNHRIFVIDEVHMLSKNAFNALLKTLEEPPPQSLFIFATTNPEAIPFTVLSRCQRYDLRRIAAQEIARCLTEIAEAEGVKISKQSLLALAREGDGSMRDSQTLLDQVISFGGSEIEDEVVSQALDLIDRRLLVSIARACVESDPKAALDACAAAGEKGSDPKRLGASLIQLLRDLVVLSIAPTGAGELVDASDEDLEELENLARRSDTTRLRRMFRILVSEQEDLAWARQPFAVLEMALVRLASLPDSADVGKLIARLDALENKIATMDAGGGDGSGGGAAAGGSSGAAAGDTPPAGHSNVRSASALAAPARAVPAVVAPPSTRETTPEPAAAEAQEISVATPPVVDDLATPEAVLDRLRGLARDENPVLFHSLDHVSIVARSSHHLHFAAASRFHEKRLEDRRSELEALCRRFFGKSIRIEISRGADTGTPASHNERTNANRESDRQVKHAALNHPSVNRALKTLRGEIIEIHTLDDKEGSPR